MFGRTFCSVPSAAPLSFIKKAVNKVNAVRSAFGFGVLNLKRVESDNDIERARS